MGEQVIEAKEKENDKKSRDTTTGFMWNASSGDNKGL